MTVSQKDIAEAVGVDRSLVAHALRGDERVSEATRARIEEAARRLGYDGASNRDARALASRRYGKRVKTGIIAVLLPPRFMGQSPRAVPFFMPLLDGIEIEAQERDLDVLLVAWHEGRLPRLVSEGGVDGVICPFTALEAARLQDLQIPIVHVLNPGPGTHDLLPDYRGGTYDATAHLTALGHRRIGFLSLPLNNLAHCERARGYREALGKAGLPGDENWLLETDSPTIEAGRAGLKQLLARDASISAVVCFNDLMAMGAIEAAQQMGRRVPDDFSVVGFDDVGEHYDFSPPLTSIFFDRLAMGRRAVQLIGAAPRENEAVQREIVATKLMVRGSTGACAH